MKPFRYCLSLILFALAPTVAAQMVYRAKLVASVPRQEAGFGTSVSISENYAIVGSSEDHRLLTGAAYIFERDGAGAWQQVAKLVDPASPLSGMFGASVSIDGSRAMVGTTSSSGAFVFERDGGGVWTEVARLSPKGSPSLARVSISGDRAIIADPWEGAAYIFERDGAGAWRQVAKLTGTSGAYFGHSVSIDGDRAVVGSYAESTIAYFAGAAYIFERDATGSWQQVAELSAGEPEEHDHYGRCVAISGNHVIIGAGSNWNDKWRARLFGRDDAGAWTDLQQFVVAPSLGLASVSIWGDRAVVGTSDGVAAYLLGRDANGRWIELGSLRVSEIHFDDEFGISVAIWDDRAVVGAPLQGSIRQGAAYVFETIQVQTEEADVFPADFSLSQNYPNPFNPTTTITYDLPQAADVTLTVYDLLGRQVRELASGTQPAGTYEMSFDATRLPSGIYFYRLTAGDYAETKRMVVVR